jgi:paraquat-inducible protein A
MVSNIKISSIIIFCLLGVLILLAQNTYNNAVKYENIYTNSIDKNEDVVVNVINSFFSKNKKKDNPLKKEKLRKLKKEAEQSMHNFVIFLALSLLTYFLFTKFIFIIYLHLASLVALIYGVITPVFFIFVHKNFALGGDVALEFDSNSIISSIEKLLEQDNYFVGGVILFFSIIFPLIKTIISLLLNILQEKNFLYTHKVSSLLSYLSKWSMSDVFVLSIFLVYLSPKKGGNIETELEMGFYIFLSYVIVSIIISTISFKKKKIT